MKERLFAPLLAGAMSVGLAACDNSGNEGSADTPAGGETTPVTDDTGEPSTGGKTVKVGVACISDENDQGYTYNFMKAVEEATVWLARRGITTEWSYERSVLEDSGCKNANIELAKDGRDIIINSSYGFKPFMLKMAPDYPEIEFISCVNRASTVDDLDNTHNASASIYEGRYLVGVAGGTKLQQMIDEGTIAAEKTVIGYVTTFPLTEVIPSYTAFYQGAKSVCPSVAIEVKYVNSWFDTPQEAVTASTLAGEGYALTSQHFDNTTPITSARDAGVLHCGYSNDMTGVAPEASLISYRMDQTPRFVYTISAVANSESFDQDWTTGYADGSVKLTKLNTVIVAPGIEEALEKAEADLAGGLHVFADLLSDHPAQDPNGEVQSIGEGEFSPESDLSQEGGLFAPQSRYVIDDIAGEQTKDQTGSKDGAGPGGPTLDFSPVTASRTSTARSNEWERRERFGPAGTKKGGWGWNRST